MRYEAEAGRTDRKPCAEWRVNEGTREEIEKQGLTLLGVVPHDDQVYEYDCDGKPTVRLPEDSPVRAALKKIVENLDL